MRKYQPTDASTGLHLRILREYTERSGTARPRCAKERQRTGFPHIGYFSATTEKEYVRIQAQNGATWLAHGAPDSPVNRPTR